MNYLFEPCGEFWMDVHRHETFLHPRHIVAIKYRGSKFNGSLRTDSYEVYDSNGEVHVLDSSEVPAGSHVKTLLRKNLEQLTSSAEDAE